MGLFDDFKFEDGSELPDDVKDGLKKMFSRPMMDTIMGQLSDGWPDMSSLEHLSRLTKCVNFIDDWDYNADTSHKVKVLSFPDALDKTPTGHCIVFGPDKFQAAALIDHDEDVQEAYEKIIAAGRPFVNSAGDPPPLEKMEVREVAWRDVLSEFRLVWIKGKVRVVTSVNGKFEPLGNIKTCPGGMIAPVFTDFVYVIQTYQHGHPVLFATPIDANGLPASPEFAQGKGYKDGEVHSSYDKPEVERDTAIVTFDNPSNAFAFMVSQFGEKAVRSLAEGSMGIGSMPLLQIVNKNGNIMNLPHTTNLGFFWNQHPKNEARYNK